MVTPSKRVPSHSRTHTRTHSHTHTQPLPQSSSQPQGWGASSTPRIQKQQVPEEGTEDRLRSGGRKWGCREQGVARVGNTHHTAARRVRFPQPWWPQLGCTPSKEPSKCGKTFRVWEGQSPTPCKSSLQAGDWRARRDREDVGCFSSGAPLEPRHPLPQHCRLSTASGCLSAAA